MTESSIDKLDITKQVHIEALRIAASEKKDQVLFVWNIKEDSYDYVIASVDEAIPEVVPDIYITRHFAHKEKPHE